MSMTLGNITEQAKRGAHLAMTFETAVKRVFGSYTVDVTRPESSTGDGVRARQRIRLVAHDGVSLVIGWVNVAEGKAELNTLGHTLALSKQRYGREIVLRPIEYLRYLEIATKVLEDQGIEVKVVAFVRDAAESIAPSAGSRPPPRRSATLPYYVNSAVTLARRVIA